MIIQSNCINCQQDQNKTRLQFKSSLSDVVILWAFKSVSVGAECPYLLRDLALQSPSRTSPMGTIKYLSVYLQITLPSLSTVVWSTRDRMTKCFAERHRRSLLPAVIHLCWRCIISSFCYSYQLTFHVHWDDLLPAHIPSTVLLIYSRHTFLSVYFSKLWLIFLKARAILLLKICTSTFLAQSIVSIFITATNTQ